MHVASVQVLIRIMDLYMSWKAKSALNAKRTFLVGGCHIMKQKCKKQIENFFC